MQKKMLHFSIVLGLLTSLFMYSCVPAKKLSYFNNIDRMQNPTINPRTQKTIMPFDKLYIKVLSTDPLTREMFSSNEEMRMDNAGAILGYIVDEKGNINFPFVGIIQVVSLTTAQAADKIKVALNDYVPETTVMVKYIDNQVTVMGEVQRQGVYNFSQDKISIYEAIGLGGGITRYGDRKNIILTRNIGEKIVHYRLNLSDSRIASKEYYYIQPNDIIVVEPLNAISSSYSNITYTTVLSSITTLIAILLFTGVNF
ncbi:MAG TPA: polysaccharide biosynthesis/export family protein [Bacteroidales bacterium]|nr:polysaccharide biosynthesis/export family protein [Bacteroidales bacterium]